MLLPKTGALATAVLIAAALITAPSLASTDAPAAASTYSTMTMRAQCEGKGRTTFSVQRLDDTYRLTASATKVVNGTWEGTFFAADPDSGVPYAQADFDVRAKHGRWRAVAEVDLHEGASLDALAIGPRDTTCAATIETTKRFKAQSGCHWRDNQVHLALRRRAAQEAVTYRIDVGRSGRWIVAIEATGPRSGSSVTTTALRPDKHGELRGVEVFDGTETRNVRVTATRVHGGSCWLSLHRSPADAAGRLLSLPRQA